MTTWPPAAIPVFPAGYGPQVADLDTWIQNNFGWISTGALLRVQQTTGGGQALASGGNILAFNSVLEDPWGGWSAGSNAWFAPVTGLYEITVTAMTVAAAIWVSAQVQVSGSAAIEGGADLCPSGTAGGGICSVVVPLVAGFDFVQGGVNVSASATTDTTSAARFPSMEIALVST